MVDTGRVSRSLAAIVVALSCAASAGAQPPEPASIALPLVYSTTPMTRNADLMLSASILATSGTDVALIRLSPSLFGGPKPVARSARIAKLALFDLPVVIYFSGLNHEWGHQSSASEYDVRSRLSLTGTPWSARPFSLVGIDAIPEQPPALAVVHGGGLEASRRLKDRSEERMLRSDRVAPGHALAAISASLDAPLYAFRDLSPERFEREFLGDVLTLVRDLVARRGIGDRAAIERTRHQVRTRMILNLIDTALWSETYGVVADHVWDGDPTVRIRWIPLGDVRLLPAVRYELSPYGPEYSVGTLFRAFGGSGRAYGRWTESIDGDRLAGGGIMLSRWSFRGVTPVVTLDAWSHAEEGVGLNGGVEAIVSGWPGRRAALTLGGGAKSAGHLVGFPLDGGAYATVGLTLTIW